MILPTNGKVVVLDDEYKEVAGLLKALSKKKIPYHYYQDETGEDLPESPIENVRLIFLDLELISGQKIPDHAIISTIGVRLERILEPKNNYILIYWSTKEKKYKKLIDDAFENGLKDYKPIITISLNKAKALKQGDKIVEYIIEEIESKSEGFSLFKVFSLWENLVNDSAGDLINDFIDFIGKDSDWDDNAKYVLYKLAQAYSGIQVNQKTELKQLEDALFTLNYTLLDSIENSILPNIERESSKLKSVISSDKKSDISFSSLINERLFISKNHFNGNIPGCLFLPEKEFATLSATTEQQFVDFIKNNTLKAEVKDKILAHKEKDRDEKLKKIEFQKKAFSKNYNVIVNSILTLSTDDPERKPLMAKILDESIKIEINISPLCDYAQAKMHCCRLLPGILLPEKYSSSVTTKNAYNYVADSIFNFEGNNYYFVFDLRFLYSLPENRVKTRIAKYKVRHQLLADIQLRLGNHINRSGVLLAP
jgi:hypothetical protein